MTREYLKGEWYRRFLVKRAATAAAGRKVAAQAEEVAMQLAVAVKAVEVVGAVPSEVRVGVSGARGEGGGARRRTSRRTSRRAG